MDNMCSIKNIYEALHGGLPAEVDTIHANLSCKRQIIVLQA